MKLLPTPAGLVCAYSRVHFNLWLVHHLAHHFTDRKIDDSKTLEALHEVERWRNTLIHKNLVSCFPEQGPDPAHSTFPTERKQSQFATREK